MRPLTRGPSSQGPYLRLKDPGPDPSKDEWAPLSTALSKDSGSLRSAQQRFASDYSTVGVDDLRIVRHHDAQAKMPSWRLVVVASICLAIGFLLGVIVV